MRPAPVRHVGGTVPQWSRNDSSRTRRASSSGSGDQVAMAIPPGVPT
ncbi:hypothetical protein [Nonomuraea sp. PA05]|nr:hypothetical protein [Nonomuraea sp. PA05]